MSKKKFFTLLLALVTALTMSLAGTALAADTWDGTTRGPVPAPVNNVITITTGAQLAGVADAVNSATGTQSYVGITIRLGGDIDLNNKEWRPIGRFFQYPSSSVPNPDNKAFSGIFDGAGHSITGLKVANDSTNYTNRGETAGLFGYIDFPTTAARSAARAASVTPAAKAQDDATALGLTGEAYDRVVAERTDLYTTFGVAPTAIQTRSVTPAPTGGVVKNLKVNGTVTNTRGQGAAGVVCWNDGLIENCYFEGTISCSPSNRSYTGGICSLLGAGTYVVNCTAKASVSATGTIYSYAGGIAGYCYAMNTGYVVNCSVEQGSIIYSHMDTGGVVGGFANKVYNCVSAADSVTVNGQNPNIAGYFTGGIVGAFGTAYNCYWLQSSSTSTTQPERAVGSTASSTDDPKRTLAELPVGSVFFAPTDVTVGNTAAIVRTNYPTGAAVNIPDLTSWNSTDESVAKVLTAGNVTGYSAGTATVSTTASSNSWSTAMSSTVSVTPESFVTVTQ
ncbi:MAG: Ig-like domain-containing protein [Cloacibacillus porcorum]|uniref:Ig-like domain-containing protein n=1 Tax=Cloacibacillus porcorum TaxID=1197717 RepID=UPI00235671E0|nr:Ig-like domain-containing protein [Cloacibacillus porcorum]MCI5864872.1 Ig-like domain-containing protein [Cloacibacillus porcorum]MDD7648998.1 Ig-like domain-containing protein [Cloacibacillus porcorum]MDY4092237.1 Ig-like domain-containing protein [Cloacibacillus porcorum]